MILFVLIAKAPESVPPANGNFVAMLLETVVENEASSPIAAASSLSVSRAAGALSITLAILAST